MNPIKGPVLEWKQYIRLNSIFNEDCKVSESVVLSFNYLTGRISSPSLEQLEAGVFGVGGNLPSGTILKTLKNLSNLCKYSYWRLFFLFFCCCIHVWNNLVQPLLFSLAPVSLYLTGKSLKGDIILLCDMNLTNFLPNFPYLNPKQLCNYCRFCLNKDGENCGIAPSALVYSNPFLLETCCVKHKCGKFTCYP